MSQYEYSREELEHQAQAELEKQEQKNVYTERPKSQRVLAWVLAGTVILGVLLYFAWIAGILS